MENVPQKQSAILDACVLYPAPVRDLLMNLAVQELYMPFWSDKIHEEWTRNLLKKRLDIKERSLLKTIKAMEITFPDANIENFELLIPRLHLPDVDDIHVLAAAIKKGVDIIITSNLKDFPQDYIAQFKIEVKHPDDFILDILQKYPSRGLEAFNLQVKRMKKPPMTKKEVFSSLEKCDLLKSAKFLRNLSL